MRLWSRANPSRSLSLPRSASKGQRPHITDQFPTVSQHVLIGRDDELALLRDEIDKLVAGQGNVVVLVGEEGMGKTQILAYLRSKTGTPVLWAEGICLAYWPNLERLPLY